MITTIHWNKIQLQLSGASEMKRGVIGTDRTNQKKKLEKHCNIIVTRY